MTNEHKQFNLSDTPTQQTQPGQDFVSSGNVARTDKTLNVKDRFIANDTETITKIGQVFKRTPFSTLVSGSIYSVSSTDFLVAITSLSYAPTIGLPRPKLAGEGKTFIIKDEAGGAATTTITVRSAGEETIDGSATSTITTNYDSKSYYTDGANWFTKK